MTFPLEFSRNTRGGVTKENIKTDFTEVMQKFSYDIYMQQALPLAIEQYEQGGDIMSDLNSSTQ